MKLHTLAPHWRKLWHDMVAECGRFALMLVAVAAPDKASCRPAALP